MQNLIMLLNVRYNIVKLFRTSEIINMLHYISIHDATNILNTKIYMKTLSYHLLNTLLNIRPSMIKNIMLLSPCL